MSANKRIAYCNFCLAVHMRPVGNRCPRVLASVARRPRRSNRQVTRTSTAASNALADTSASNIVPVPPPTAPPVTTVTRPNRQRRASASEATDTGIIHPNTRAAREASLGIPGPQGRPVPPGDSSGARDAVRGQPVMTPTDRLLQTLSSQLGEALDEIRSLKTRVVTIEEEAQADRDQWEDIEGTDHFIEQPTVQPYDQNIYQHNDYDIDARQHFADDPRSSSSAPNTASRYGNTSLPSNSAHAGQHTSVQFNQQAPNPSHSARYAHSPIDLPDAVSDRLTQIRHNQQATRRRHATSQPPLAGMQGAAVSFPGEGQAESTLFDWPQDHIFRFGEEKVPFNELTMAEFSAGFTSSANGAKPGMQRLMYSFYNRFMIDAAMHSWAICRNFAFVVISRIKKGMLEWGETSEIEQLRASHLYGASAARVDKPANTRGMGNHSNYGNYGQGASSGGKPTLCHRFNDGSCTSRSSHRTGGKFYQHSCTFCYSRFNRVFSHPETECNNKAKMSSTAPKNDQQGLRQPTGQ